MTIVKGQRRGEKYRLGRNNLDHDALHRVLWRKADANHRIVLVARELAVRYDVNYEAALRAVTALEATGRMAFVGFAGKGGIRRYQLADPEHYDRWDSSTHATVSARPQWG